MPLKNLPTDVARPLAALATCRPGQVQSVAFTQVDAPASLVLLAFAADESVSEEVYTADTLYLVVEGTARIVVEGRTVPLAAGEVLCVPAGTSHAVEALGPLKILQVSVP